MTDQIEEVKEIKKEIKILLYPDNPVFDYNGETLTLVNVFKRFILAARVKKTGGKTDIRYRRVRVEDLTIETLKSIDIWDNLPKGLQNRAISQDEANKNAGREKMAHARSKRKNKYEGIPRSIKCSECGEPKVISPANILKRAEKESRSVENWIKEFRCQSCCPSKGRKANPAFAHLPKELVCKCGNKVKTSGSAITAAADRRKITPEEYVKGYECQICSPSRKGRKKKK